MAQEFQAELGRVSNAHWISTKHNDRSFEWLPLIKISDSGIWLGIDRESQWILGRTQGNIVLSNADMALPQPWLTVLELGETVFWERLREAAHLHGLSADYLAAKVPIDDIIALGLRTRNQHWAERATHWLTERQPREDHIDLLRETSTSRWATQWTRQTASRMVAALKRQTRGE
ncbi:hypothetical protein ACFVUY_27145 [Kitasatospora sp. NPDC058063]|uniref:hypothetical protein n=1 Tax=unclassified Kitasatospora TaxID=2633591 RepID=UPI0036DA0786